MLKISTLNVGNKNNSPSKKSSGENEEKNKGGILGGIGYALGNLGLGVASTIEGVVDMFVAAGPAAWSPAAALFLGIPDAIYRAISAAEGKDTYAQEVFKNNVVGEWHESLVEEYNPGEVMSFVGDVTHGIGQSSAFLLDALVPGLGSTTFFLGTSGQSISSAADKTGEVGAKEVAYGLASGGVELALGKALDGMSTVAKGLTKGGLKNVTKSAIRKGLGRQVMTSAASEFGEEFITEYTDTILQRATGVDPNATTTLKDAIYAGLVGAVSGGLTTGVAGVSKNRSNQKRGANIIKNGNSQTLVNTANIVADRLAGEGTNFENAADWITALRGQVDAYNKLPVNEKMGLRGQTILGEMQASLFFAETQANVELVKKKIQNKSEQDKATIAEYVSRMTGKKYTVADIDSNKDNLASTLAVLDYVSGIADIDGALADMQQESGIADVIARNQGAESSAVVGADPVAVGAEQYDIVNLEDGKNYVRASRKVIEGDNVANWRKQISNFFNELLDGKPSLDIATLEGDVLTITKNETAAKARDRYRQADGKKEKMSDAEFKVKLNAESHIDELAEISTKNKKGAPDTKGHTFAKDGFSYRTAYFQDHDGQYYKITLSVGNSDGTATIYNVGKIEEGELPSAKISAVVGSQAPRSSSSSNSIPQKSDLSTVTDKKFDLDENAVNLRSGAVEGKTVETGAETVQDETAGASPRPTGEFGGQGEVIDGATSSSTVSDGPPKSDVFEENSQLGSPSVSSLEKADLDRAKRDAERIIEWERKEAPTVDELNRVRGAVKNFDSLSGDRQRAIVRMVRSAKNIDESVIRGVSNIMAITNKKGAVLAPDVEIRFAEFGKDSTRRGIKTEVGGKTVIVLNANATYKDTIRGTIAHEIVHYLENRKGYKALADFAMKRAKADKVAQVRETYEGVYKGENAEAKIEGEVVASVVAELLGSEKFLKRYAQMGEEQSSVVKRIARFVKGIANALKDKDGEASKVARQMMELVDKALGSEVEGEKSGEKASFDISPDEAREWEKPITMDDVETLRSIGRKSINSFLAEDIKKAQKWAYKFYKELGVKSPFFRAWFGDWRQYERSNFVNILKMEHREGKNPRGQYKNSDTGWVINSSSVGYDETISHSGKDKKSILAMQNIDKIIENAVLLDTEVSEYGRGKKSVYTAFMHKFYALIDIDGEKYIAKMAVDESHAPGQNDTNKKFYHVRAIEIETASSVGIGKSHTPIMENTVSTVSIADLFEIVKRNDKEFTPNSVNEYMLNEDGTPKVFYHGTNADFTVFDLKKSGANFGVVSEGMFFFTDKKKAYPSSAEDYAKYVTNAKGGKEKIYDCYLKMHKPLVLDSSRSYDPISYYDRNAEKIYEKYFEGDYDGIIVTDFSKKNSTSTLALVDNSAQIKSATNNIGTFDKSEPDIRYDLDPEAVRKKGTDIESTDTENGKTYTKKSLVGAIETVLSEFKSELFGTRMVTISKSKISKLVDDHLYRQMNRKTDDNEKGSISTKLAVASMLDDYISYLRVTDEDGNIRKLTDVYSESEIDEIKQKLANYLTEEINSRGVRTVDAESKGEKLAKKEEDRQLKKRAERGGFTEKDTRDAVKRITEYTDEQLSEFFDSQSAKVSKVQKEEFARDLLMALTTKDGKKRIKQIVDRFASDYVDKVRITVDGKRTYLSSLYDDEGIAALKKELAERMQKDLTASGKDSLYIDIINRLENAKREFSRDLLDAEKTFKYGNAIIAEVEKLKENVGYRKRSVNDSVIYMLEKEMAKVVDHQKQISLSSVNKAIKMWSDFYNKENPLLNHGGTLTDTASDYFDVMRLKIDDFLASRKLREGYALNGKEMELLSQIIGSARSILINHDTRFLDGKRISVKKEIYSFIKDQDTYNSTRSKGGKSIESSLGKWLDKFGLTKIGQATNQGYLYKIIAPEALIGNIEGYSHDGILSKAYNAVQSGADKAAKLRAQLLSPFENFLDGRNADGQKDESLLWEDEKGRKHKYRDRLLNKTFEFQGEQITYGEAIYFYGITKRAQAEKSLNIEGVSVYDDKTGNFRTEFENIDIDSVQAELESHFTDLDYKYIEMFEKLFNADARRIKGEADIEFAGWTNLVSGYYTPLIKDAFTRDNSVSERPAIDNLMIYYKERFQKHTTDNAKQLQIVNIQSVIESYVSGLASYVHLSQPMKTFDMLWNGTIWLDENGNMVDEEEVYRKRSSQNDGENGHKYKRYSIRKTVNRDVWQGADKYFIDLFNDIQGKRNMSDFDKAVSKWTGRWASGVLGANIKVIFTQTTSLVAATKNISPKNIASALSILSNRKAFAEVAKRADEYSDIIFARSFDLGATRSQGNIDKLEDFNKNWGKGIEITDRAVCILLYHAAEIQVERTRGFKIGSEENANAAKELADQTIHETQAMTSQTERSAWQRETNLIAKTITMFTSDAAKQLSYLYNAASRLIAHHRRVQNGDTSYEGDIKADKKALRRALAVSLSTTAMLTAIAQLFKLLYHQEEEELEDQAVDVLKDFTSNALGILPLASEIYDKIFNDYDVSIMVLDMFNTVVDDGSTLVQNVFKTASGEYISTNQIVKPMYNIAKNVSTMMGIPLAPAMRTVTGLVRRISPGTAYEAHDSFLYNMSYTSDLKKAVENGDTTLAAHILETLYKNEINAMVTSTELEEVARLYKLGNTGVIPQKIGATVNDVTLDRNQRAKFESIYSQASAKVDELIRSEYYADLNDEQRAKAIKNLYSLYYNRAAAEVAGVEWSNAQAYSHLTTNYAALFAAQAYKSGLSPYKTLRGKEVSVKEQFVDYVENLRLSDADKLVVLYANGYRDAATKKKMLAYINALSISEDEKAKIAERLGFAVENGKVVEKKEELEIRA